MEATITEPVERIIPHHVPDAIHLVLGSKSHVAVFLHERKVLVSRVAAPCMTNGLRWCIIVEGMRILLRGLEPVRVDLVVDVMYQVMLEVSRIRSTGIRKPPLFQGVPNAFDLDRLLLLRFLIQTSLRAYTIVSSTTTSLLPTNSMGWTLHTRVARPTTVSARKSARVPSLANLDAILTNALLN
jgi:hypothetical protein